MQEKNICLVGFMGSGKTTIAQALAHKMQRQVISTDVLIIEKEGREINDIFQKDGEAYFRKVEKDVVKEISGYGGVIVDCGGGVVLDSENISRLKQNGIVFYLSATPETIYKRVRNQTHRPLLNVADPMQVVRDLLDKRESFYEQANFTIPTDSRSLDDVCTEILSIYKGNQK
jgi:shikimate kinase